MASVPLSAVVAVSACQSDSRSAAHLGPRGEQPRARSELVQTPPSLEGSVSRTFNLVLVGDLEGVIEPCGCSERPAGGMDRVFHAIDRLRERVAPLFVAAGGNLLYPPDPAGSGIPLAQIQENLTAEALGAALAMLEPSVVVPGPVDLRRGGSALRSLEARGVPSLVAHGSPVEGLKESRRSVLLEEGGLRIGLLAVSSSGTTASEQIRRLRARGAAMVLAFVHDPENGPGAPDQADVVVHTGTQKAEVSLEGGTLHVFPGRHAEEIWLLRLWPGSDANAPWQLVRTPPERPTTRPMVKAERILLDENAPRDPDARALIDQLFARIETSTTRAIQTDATRHAGSPTAASAYAYVGSENCAPCHVEAYFWWRQDAHGRAFTTLEARRRAFDLACVSCHVTGYGQPGGASLGNLADLKNVGCESCHGPGGRHIEDPRARPPSVQRIPPAHVCIACHDAEHSVGFEYEPKRAKLRGTGHGMR